MRTVIEYRDEDVVGGVLMEPTAKVRTVPAGTKLLKKPLKKKMPLEGVTVAVLLM